MIRKFAVAGAVVVAVLALASPASSWAAPQEPKPPAYTRQEYDAFEAARKEANAQQRARLLDDFAVKFPSSELLPFVYRVQYLTQYELKNHPKTIEYADRLLALGDKLEFTSRLEALVARAQAFYLGQGQPALAKPEQLTKARETALEGLKTVEQWQKPEAIADPQYQQQKRGFTILFHTIAGMASLSLKDYRAAAESLKASLAIDPGDALNNYRLGVSYFQHDPPHYMDGFWAVARSLALKVPNEPQVRNYLRSQVARYQLTACEKELDAQIGELLALAAGSAERPAGYKIPSAADLEAARKNADWLGALKGGGDAAKVTWLAMCGQEFPEVYARLFEVTSGNDSIVLKVYTGSSQEELEAATGPNCEVKVTGEPRAANFQKDDYFRFSGTLAGYTPDPFLIRWEGAKINPEDLPEEKAAPAKQPAKRPSGKRPTKRPPAR